MASLKSRLLVVLLFLFPLLSNAQNNALDFDGIDDIVSIPSNPNLQLGQGNFSVEFWAKPTLVNSAFHYVITKDNTNASIEFMVGIASNNRWFAYTRDLANYVSSTTTAAAGTWYHIACTFDGTNFKLYVNGIQEGSILVATGPITNASDVLIGARTASAPNQHFQGTIEEVRLWNRAICQDEIQNNLNCEIPGGSDGLVANYHFNVGTGGGNNLGASNMPDLSGYGYDGALSGFTLNGIASNWLTSTATVSGNCVTFRDINITGSSNNIPAGSTTASQLNGTYLGSVAYSGGTFTRTFTIQNTGGTTLTASAINITGPDAAMFVAGPITPSGTILSGASATFDVTFTAASLGVKNATITVVNDDCDESSYDFLVEGRGVNFGAALNFNGSSSYLQTGDIDLPGSFTLEAWVKTFSGGQYCVMSKGDGNGTGDENYIFEIVNGKIGLHINHGGTGQWTYSNTTIPNNSWCHVAVTYDDITHTDKFYLNGVLDGANVRISASPSQSNSNMLIGVQGYGCQCNFFNGTMDEVRIWDRKLEQCEIQSYMNCEIAFTPDNLVASYSFNVGLDGIEGATNFGLTTMPDWPSGVYTAQLFSFSYVGSTANWVAPGGVVSGTACTHIPEIRVTGNGITILGDSSNVPTVPDNSNFGSVTVGGAPQDELFTILNSGGLLSFTANPTYVVISGSSDFAVQSDAASVVNTNSFTNFTIRFTPSSVGVKTAKVRIMSNDCDEPIYTFNIQGTGTAAPPGAALSSAGTAEYISLNNSSDFNFIETDSFTVEFWTAYFSTQQDVIFSKLTNIAPYNGYEVSIQNGRINFFMCSNFSTTNYLSVSTVTPYNNNIWHHIAVVYPGVPDAAKIKIYVDGVNQATTIIQNTLTGTIANSNGAYISARGNGGQSFFFTGVLDELRIWDKVLCESEITSFKDCEKTGAETGLIACYHFNQGAQGADNTAVTTLIDAAGGNNNGTLTGYTLSGYTSDWVASSGVTTGTVCGALIQPEINVRGAGASIVSGDNTPSIADYTDLGDIQVGNLGGQNYHIDNTGTGTLTLPNTPRVSISGTDFQINAQPPSSSATTGQTLTFNVLFSPTSTGIKTAVVTIESNDCNESIYTFTVQGTGVVPDIQLHSDGIDYASGDTYDLPATPFGGGSDDMYFEIRNTAINTMLNITGTPKVVLSGPDASDFFLTTVPIVTPVGGGLSTGFFVKFFPSAVGTRFGVMTIASDDPDEPSYVINLRGIGLEPPEIDVIQGALNVATGTNYNFGNYVINNPNGGKNFTIQNLSVDGKLALNGTPRASLSLADANQFTLSITSLPDTIQPSSSTNFNAKFLPTTVGNKTALITIPNNDPDEAPYLIYLIGKGVVSGDLDSSGTISAGEITGDTSGNGSIEYPSEVTGDINGNGTIGTGEIAGDNDGNGVINNPEIAGNTNGNATIDNGEITGDASGNGVINGTEFAGDIDGNGILDPNETVGDIDGNGSINAPEVAGDINGDGVADPDPAYVLVGKGTIVSNYVSRYSVQPELPATILPAYYSYAWVYSDTTLYMIKDTSRYFMDVVAHNQTSNGVLSCIIYRFGLPYDTLDFNITVNKNYINIAELAELTSECAHVANPLNDCEESFIDYFKLNTINYDGNGCVRGGFQDLTGSGYTTDLEMGFTYTVELKPNKLLFFPNPLDPSQNDTTSVFYAVWIDYNNDGDFEDFAEYVKNGDSKSASAKLINITIANNELYEGSRRMRVGMKTGSGFASSDACGINAIGSSGEIEDYLITLVPMGALQAPNFLTPNNDGSNDLFSIKGVNIEKSRILTVINKAGSVVYQEEFYGDKELWGGTNDKGELLPKGTYYYIFKNGNEELKSFLEIDY